MKELIKIKDIDSKGKYVIATYNNIDWLNIGYVANGKIHRYKKLNKSIIPMRLHGKMTRIIEELKNANEALIT